MQPVISDPTLHNSAGVFAAESSTQYQQNQSQYKFSIFPVETINPEFLPLCFTRDSVVYRDMCPGWLYKSKHSEVGMFQPMTVQDKDYYEKNTTTSQVPDLNCIKNSSNISFMSDISKASSMDLCDASDSDMDMTITTLYDESSDGSMAKSPLAKKETPSVLRAAPSAEDPKKPKKLILKDPRTGEPLFEVIPATPMPSDKRPLKKKSPMLEIWGCPTHNGEDNDKVVPMRVLNLIKKSFKDKDITEDARKRFQCKAYSTFEACMAFPVKTIGNAKVDSKEGQKWNITGCVKQLFKEVDSDQHMRFYSDVWKNLSLTGVYHVIDLKTEERVFKKLTVIPHVVERRVEESGGFATKRKKSFRTRTRQQKSRSNSRSGSRSRRGRVTRC